MKTRMLPFNDQSLKMAADCIKTGGLVAFPTETVYGLGGNALNGSTVTAIFHAKGRPADNPLIVHIADAKEAETLCHWSDAASILADAFWPGPLTLLLPKKSTIPEETTAKLQTVALRMPRHPIALALIKASGCPIAAPSANSSGHPSPTTAEHVFSDLKGRIPLILDGGSCEVGVESTVLDLTHEVPVILRPGAVTPEQIAMVLGECRVADSIMRPLGENESAPSPGMRHRHYAPKAEMVLVKGEKEEVARHICSLSNHKEDVCIIALSDHLPLYGNRTVMDMGADAQEAAHRLFYLLRESDCKQYKTIYCETLPETGIGLAVMNRMARAASFNIIDISNNKEKKE